MQADVRELRTYSGHTPRLKSGAAERLKIAASWARRDLRPTFLSLEPSYTFFNHTAYTFTFSVLVSVGLGHRFYAGTNYGYFNVGPKLAAPLSFLPASFGKWNASVGYTYWNLGRTTAALPLAEGRHYRNVIYTAIGLAF